MAYSNGRRGVASRRTNKSVYDEGRTFKVPKIECDSLIVGGDTPLEETTVAVTFNWIKFQGAVDLGNSCTATFIKTGKQVSCSLATTGVLDLTTTGSLFSGTGLDVIPDGYQPAAGSIRLLQPVQNGSNSNGFSNDYVVSNFRVSSTQIYVEPATTVGALYAAQYLYLTSIELHWQGV